MPSPTPHPLSPFLRCTLAEGPLWDEDRKCLWWVDILPGHIHRYDPEIGAHKAFALGQTVGSIGLCEDGALIAAMGQGFHRVHPETGDVTFMMRPEDYPETARFNEGKPDPAGRFWAGTMSLTKVPKAGALYTLDADCVATRQLTDITISNGLAWTPDASTMYYIDTPTHRIDAFDYDLETAAISARKTVVKIPDGCGGPDGMSMDTGGGLWVALWGGWCVARFDPQTGEETARISLPAAQVSSCTFGGDDYRDMYITTAQVELKEAEVAAQPLAGCVFVVKDCGYRGYPPYRFAGRGL